MSGRSQARFFCSAGEEGSRVGKCRTQPLPSTAVPSAPGQAGAVQLPKETREVGVRGP